MIQADFSDCLFTRNHVAVVVYVDDLLITGPKSEATNFLRDLKKKFELRSGEMDEDSDFLGCRIRRLSNGDFTLDQDDYAAKLVEEFFKNDEIKANINTPLPENFNLVVNNDSPVMKTAARAYRSALGKLGYLRHSRADFLYPISALSRLQQYPTQYQTFDTVHSS